MDALVRCGIDRNHALDGARRCQRERLSWLFWSGHTDDFCVSILSLLGRGSPRIVALIWCFVLGCQIALTIMIALREAG